MQASTSEQTAAGRLMMSSISSFTQLTPTTLILSYLWSRPTDAVLELSYLEASDPYRNGHGLKGEQQQQQ